MGSLVFIKAAPEDMEQVAVLFGLSRLEAMPYLKKVKTTEESVTHFSSKALKNSKFFIAIDQAEKKIAGFIVFSTDFVDYVYILPERQRHGIGSKLLALAKGQSSHLQTYVFEKNSSAVNFFTKNGFVVSKKSDGADNEDKEPDVFMEWIRKT